MTFVARDVAAVFGQLRVACSCGDFLGYDGQPGHYLVAPSDRFASGFSDFFCPTCNRIYRLQLEATATPTGEGPNDSMAELQHSFAAW